MLKRTVVPKLGNSGWAWAGRIAGLMTVFGALVLALDARPPMAWLFLLWGVSSILWIWYGWKLESGSIVFTQLVFVIIDLTGLIHYWVMGNAAWMRWFGG